eukprot:360531-Chlamydomonas_euryale.AAC.5
MVEFSTVAAEPLHARTPATWLHASRFDQQQQKQQQAARGRVQVIKYNARGKTDRGSACTAGQAAAGPAAGLASSRAVEAGGALGGFEPRTTVALPRLPGASPNPRPCSSHLTRTHTLGPRGPAGQTGPPLPGRVSAQQRPTRAQQQPPRRASSAAAFLLAWYPLYVVRPTDQQRGGVEGAFALLANPLRQKHPLSLSPAPSSPGPEDRQRRTQHRQPRGARRPTHPRERVASRWAARPRSRTHQKKASASLLRVSRLPFRPPRGDGAAGGAAGGRRQRAAARAAEMAAELGPVIPDTQPAARLCLGLPDGRDAQ